MPRSPAICAEQCRPEDAAPVRNDQVENQPTSRGDHENSSFAIACTACRSSWPQAASAQAAKETLTIDLPNDAATLDPHLQWNTDSYTIYRNIFDNLLTRDADGARSCRRSPPSWNYDDDTTINFKIRDDVTFQDGSKLTADDVAFSINRIIDPDAEKPAAVAVQPDRKGRGRRIRPPSR